MRVFEPASIGAVELSNRIIRSATFEGLCDGEGWPGPAYSRFYARLSTQGLGALITGFTFVSRDGRAMQPGQAGLECEEKLAAFRRVTGAVHQSGCRIFLQLAHAGRQTSPAATGGTIYAPSPGRSRYFNHRPRPLTLAHIQNIIEAFAAAARRSRDAGFDGVQLHAAHGYLIHQFLHPEINRRRDEYGVPPGGGIGTAFLERIVHRIRAVCGGDYPLLIKVSSGDSCRHPMTAAHFERLVRFLDSLPVDAIEISFGTMEQPFDIFRGESIPLQAILEHNPRYATEHRFQRWCWKRFVLPGLRRRLRPFTPMYNLAAAQAAKRQTRIPIIVVGGFRTGAQIRQAIEQAGIDFVSLCRPIICEPDFVRKLRADNNYQSRCANCNRCAVMCDSGWATRCYGPRPASTSFQAYEN